MHILAPFADVVRMDASFDRTPSLTFRRSPIRRPARATMEWSKVTHDRRRLRLWETLRGEVGCVLQRGPSFAWLSQAIGASKRGRRRFRDLSVRWAIGFESSRR